MHALLTQWGCLVTTASDQEEAVSACKEFIPDVILADYHLDYDRLGTDAILAIREQLGLDIPAVMLTADRSDECRQLFNQLQLQVINKPVKPGKLRALLTHIINQ